MSSLSTTKGRSTIDRGYLLIALTGVLTGLTVATLMVLIFEFALLPASSSHATCDRLFANFMHADNIVDLERARILLSGNNCDLASRTERSLTGQ